MSENITITFTPYPGSGSSGGASGGNQVNNGSITNPGQSGQVAQAVQGISGGVPMPVLGAGSVGADFTANPITGPGNASSFVYNGVTVNLLTTIPANPSRKSLEINNTTGALAVLVIDDGANTAGTVSLFPLAFTTADNQGGDWSTTTEQGRIRIYGSTGTTCFVRGN